MNTETNNRTIDDIALDLIKNIVNYNGKMVSLTYEGITLFNFQYRNYAFKNEDDVIKVKMQIINCFNELKAMRNAMNNNNMIINQRSKILLGQDKVSKQIFLVANKEDTIYDIAFKLFCLNRQGLLGIKCNYNSVELTSNMKNINEIINCYNKNFQNKNKIESTKIDTKQPVQPSPEEYNLEDKNINTVIDLYQAYCNITQNCETKVSLVINNEQRSIVIHTTDKKSNLDKKVTIHYKDNKKFDYSIKDELIKKITNNNSELVRFSKDVIDKNNTKCEAEYENGTTLELVGFTIKEINKLQKTVNELNSKIVANEEIARTCNITDLMKKEDNNGGFVDNILMGILIVFLLIISLMLIFTMIK